MMRRDKEGYIIDTLPKTAVYIEGHELLVIAEKGGLAEYTPDAFNRVNRYFRNLQLKFDIDNLCDAEWKDLTSRHQILELPGICKIAHTAQNHQEAEQIAEKLKSLSPSDSYQKDIAELTILDIRVFTKTSVIHIELPYCAIAKICSIC
ncbi:MAG: hypothetical protein IK015_02670 [Treponema sp.]|nr:hypothetical protein [Treponema sp.]